MVFVVAKKQFIKCQSYHDIETNQSTGFYVIATLAFNEFSDNMQKCTSWYMLCYIPLKDRIIEPWLEKATCCFVNEQKLL